MRNYTKLAEYMVGTRKLLDDKELVSKLLSSVHDYIYYKDGKLCVHYDELKNEYGIYGELLAYVELWDLYDDIGDIDENLEAISNNYKYLYNNDKGLIFGKNMTIRVDIEVGYDE